MGCCKSCLIRKVVKIDNLVALIQLRLPALVVGCSVGTVISVREPFPFRVTIEGISPTTRLATCKLDFTQLGMSFTVEDLPKVHKGEGTVTVAGREIRCAVIRASNRVGYAEFYIDETGRIPVPLGGASEAHTQISATAEIHVTANWKLTSCEPGPIPHRIASEFELADEAGMWFNYEKSGSFHRDNRSGREYESKDNYIRIRDGDVTGVSRTMNENNSMITSEAGHGGKVRTQTFTEAIAHQAGVYFRAPDKPAVGGGGGGGGAPGGPSGGGGASLKAPPPASAPLYAPPPASAPLYVPPSGPAASASPHSYGAVPGDPAAPEGGGHNVPPAISNTTMLL